MFSDRDFTGPFTGIPFPSVHKVIRNEAGRPCTALVCVLVGTEGHDAGADVRDMVRADQGP